MNDSIENLVNELKNLDNEPVNIDGSQLKPSQCYHFETNPVHMLFNTNCPDSLKEKIQAILAKHGILNESSS